MQRGIREGPHDCLLRMVVTPKREAMVTSPRASFFRSWLITRRPTELVALFPYKMRERNSIRLHAEIESFWFDLIQPLLACLRIGVHRVLGLSVGIDTGHH